MRNYINKNINTSIKWSWEGKKPRKGRSLRQGQKIIGLNIWNSTGTAPPPKNALGLQRFGIHLPSRQSLELLQENLTKNTHPFSQSTSGETDRISIIVQDSDEIEIEIFSN